MDETAPTPVKFRSTYRAGMAPCIAWLCDTERGGCGAENLNLHPNNVRLAQQKGLIVDMCPSCGAQVELNPHLLVTPHVQAQFKPRVA